MASLLYRQCRFVCIQVPTGAHMQLHAHKSSSAALCPQELNAHSAEPTGKPQPICIKEFTLQCAHGHQVSRLLQPNLSYLGHPKPNSAPEELEVPSSKDKGTLKSVLQSHPSHGWAYSPSSKLPSPGQSQYHTPYWCPLRHSLANRETERHKRPHTREQQAEQWPPILVPHCS